MFDNHKDIVVRRVVLRLLRALEGPEQVIAATRSILPGLSGPSAKLHLISILGHKEHEGHKLVSESDAAELERAWREEVRAASAHELAGVDNPLRLFLVAQTGVESGEEPVIVPDAPELTLALLRSAVGETRSQGMGSRAIQRSPTLTWDALVEVFGGEPELARRVADLGALEPTDSELLTLVARYLDGWRPEEFR